MAHYQLCYIRMEPPAGFEPARPGPKPGALSAELRRRYVQDRIRTCDLPGRGRALCPLSYKDLNFPYRLTRSQGTLGLCPAHSLIRGAVRHQRVTAVSASPGYPGERKKVLGVDGDSTDLDAKGSIRRIDG